jgi:hypothetical protein
MPIKVTEDVGSSAGDPHTLTTGLSPTIKLTGSSADANGAGAWSAGPISGIVIGVCVAVAVLSVLLYVFYYRKQKHSATKQQTQVTGGAAPLTDVNDDNRVQTSDSQSKEQHNGCRPMTVTATATVGDDSGYAVIEEARGSPSTFNKRIDDIEGFVKVRDNPAYSTAYETVSTSSKECKIPLMPSAHEQTDDIYWQPAKSVEKLYAQFDGKRFRRILGSEIVVHETLGTGEFGTVVKGTWQGSGGGTTIAVKMLNSPSVSNRVRFLQEGAIMGQFKHNNIVALRGLVLEGEPLMVAVEFMDNGDLKKYLQTVKERTGLASRFLRMAREIAAGMKYLAHKAFIHRDLAARNIMLDGTWTCKIGDFGLSRDLADSDYYMTRGGRIPVRWTAPEVTSSYSNR